MVGMQGHVVVRVTCISASSEGDRRLKLSKLTRDFDLQFPRFRIVGLLLVVVLLVPLASTISTPQFGGVLRQAAYGTTSTTATCTTTTTS